MNPKQFDVEKMSQTKRAFTLIELLVVIAIIGLLAAILFPVFATARDKARQSACLSNLKQIGLGVVQYMQDNDETTPALETSLKGWAGKIYPYVKNAQVFVCPSDENKALGFVPATTTINGVAYAYRRLSYVYNFNVHGFVAGTARRGLLASQFTGPSQSILMFEIDPGSGIMKAPIECTEEIDSPINNGLLGGSYHAIAGKMDNTLAGSIPWELRHKAGDGGNYLFLDGHAKFLRGSSVSAGSSPANSAAAQSTSPPNCNTAGDGGNQATCAEGVSYSGVGKHAATMSWN
jgi:prepilin-type N-terminal cleavage/methylation domain-containing protein/prepilin-type processing-associated H-X9-DG protein